MTVDLTHMQTNPSDVMVEYDSFGWDSNLYMSGQASIDLKVTLPCKAYPSVPSRLSRIILKCIFQPHMQRQGQYTARIKVTR